ncbi:unnamed protein product [Mortierella alpina]
MIDHGMAHMATTEFESNRDPGLTHREATGHQATGSRVAGAIAAQHSRKTQMAPWAGGVSTIQTSTTCVLRTKRRTLESALRNDPQPPEPDLFDLLRPHWPFCRPAFAHLQHTQAFL